jgi:hypothetical protein
VLHDTMVLLLMKLSHNENAKTFRKADDVTRYNPLWNLPRNAVAHYKFHLKIALSVTLTRP